MSLLIVGPTEGERLSNTTEIKAGREELAVVEFLYPSGKAGPNPHIHREHSDCFWVLDGELTFLLGVDGEARRAGAGCFALVPPEVVHTFRNDGPDEARFLNLHAPGKEFDDYLRAMVEGRSFDFDSFDPPEDGGRPVSEALVRDDGEGELGPDGSLIKAGREHGIGSLALSLTTVEPRFPGPELHVHQRMVDSFYVLEGTLTLRLEDNTVEVGPGTYALVPPGTVHTFANEGDEPVRMLNITAPAADS